MNRLSFRFSLLIACMGVAGITGCSDGPKPPPRFQINPEQAAADAMETYDKNHDGKLDAKELEASPPLQELLLNLKHREPSHPDFLTGDDIKRRMQEWIDAPATLFSSSVIVRLDGQPLEGAKVTYTPEKFLGPSYHEHSATTNVGGGGSLDAELPDFPNEIYVGLYRVTISKIVNGKESLPPQYNTQTTLGREVALGVRNSRLNVLFFLKSK